MRQHRIAAIGGDGIGPEVIAAGCRVLEATAAAWISTRSPDCTR